MTALAQPTLVEQVAVISPATRERVTRMVHEAMITMRQQLARDATPRGRACWPDYVYERDDHGDRPAIEELRALLRARQHPQGRGCGQQDRWRHRDSPAPLRRAGTASTTTVLKILRRAILN